MNLLIHADPGARSGFVAAWLTDKLSRGSFDVGSELRPCFRKIHHLKHIQDLTDFSGVKIRIRPTIDTIDQLSLLFLRKNVYTQIPDFTRNEHSLETITKLIEFSKEIFARDNELDYSLYDHVIDFSDTFDTDTMIELYAAVHDRSPTAKMIDTLSETNLMNHIPIDRNHACAVLKMIFQREQELGLAEEHRFWSIVDIYDSTPVDQISDTIYDSITPDNYGILL
jgi:hypothetical protein